MGQWHIGCRWENRLKMPLSYLLRYHLISSFFSSWFLLQLTLFPHLLPLLQHFSHLLWRFVSQVYADLRWLCSGNGTCWAGVGRMSWRRSEQVGASSPLPLSPQYVWCGAREVCSTLQTRACLQGQWGGQEGILCSLKSGIARRVGTSTETSTSLEMSLGMGYQFHVELPDSRAQRGHLVHPHGPAQHKLC